MIFFLLLLGIVLSNNLVAQIKLQQLTEKVTLDQEATTALQIIEALDRQSNYGFTFAQEQLAMLRIPAFKVTGSLGDALIMLQKQYGLQFVIRDGNIAVKPGEKATVTPAPQKTPGKVSGKVIDEENGQPVIGVTIRIDNTGTTTNAEGAFSIALPKGSYSAIVSYIGYGTKEITGIEVKDNQVFELNITLKRKKGQLSAVVVKANANKESTASLFVKQKNNSAITDGISAELIRRTPDRNAGDALKRVTGISVLEGKYVVVRGLSDRYNYTMLNGGILPSTEPDRRTFSLDLIPALAIESIVVTKTATADLPGEFAGGVVQVTTRDFPEQDFISVAIGSGFYEGQTGQPFLKDRNGKKDWLGYDDGGRALPSELNYNSKELNRFYPEERFRISSALSKGWEPVQSGNAQPTQTLQLGYGKTFHFKNDTRLGIIALGNYRRDQTIDQIQRYDLAEYIRYSGTRVPGDTLGFKRSYPDEKGYRYQVNEGVLLNIAYQFEKNKLSVKSMFNRDFETLTTVKMGEKTMGEGMGDIVPNKVRDMHPVQKTLLGTQLQGEHKLGLENPATLTWNIAYNSIKKYEPNQTRIGYVNLYYADTVRYKDYNYFIPEFGSIENASRLYTDLKEDAYNLNFAVATPFRVLGQPQILKSGAFTQYRKREYFTRNLGYFDAARGVITPNDQGFISTFPVNLNQPIDKILSPENFRPGGFVAVNYELPANEYTGGANLASAFVNMESNILRNLKLIYGARIEFYTMSLSTSKETARRLPGSGGSGDDQSPMDYIRYNTDVLPSVSMIYSPLPTVNVRAAYAKTLTRPEFREISPYAYFDFVSGYITVGNPDLNRGTIENLDFRIEWFPSAGEIFSASLFRKNLKDPVEITTVTTSETAKYLRYYKNIEGALNWGFEFEMRKNLYFGTGPEWLRNIILFGNYSRIHSNIQGKNKGYEGIKDVDLRPRPLMGQSPYLVNAGILINAFKNTFSLSAALNRAGRRIVVVGTTAEELDEYSAYPDIYENPRNQLDIQLGQKLFKQRLEIRLNAANLLNDDFVQYQDWDLNGKYSGPTFDATTYLRKSFRNYTLTLSYTFKK